VATKGGKSKETKDVLEMLGEFFREAAVLILIFYPIEVARKDNGDVPSPFYASGRRELHCPPVDGNCT